MGPLGGDSMLRTIESSLRRIIIDPEYAEGTPVKRLTEIGIEFNRNGTLDYSADKFNKALSANPQGVAKFLRGDGFSTGFVSKVKREINALLDSQSGSIANRKRGQDTKIKQINDRIDNKERQLVGKEDGLRQKFADLEQKMSALNQQGGAVAALRQGG